MPSEQNFRSCVGGLLHLGFIFSTYMSAFSSLTSYLAQTVKPKTTFPRWLCRLDGHCGVDRQEDASADLWNEESNTRPWRSWGDGHSQLSVGVLSCVNDGRGLGWCHEQAMDGFPPFQLTLGYRASEWGSQGFLRPCQLFFLRVHSAVWTTM